MVWMGRPPGPHCRRQADGRHGQPEISSEAMHGLEFRQRRPSPIGASPPSRMSTTSRVPSTSRIHSRLRSTSLVHAAADRVRGTPELGVRASRRAARSARRYSPSSAADARVHRVRRRRSRGMAASAAARSSAVGPTGVSPTPPRPHGSRVRFLDDPEAEIRRSSQPQAGHVRPHDVGRPAVRRTLKAQLGPGTTEPVMYVPAVRAPFSIQDVVARRRRARQAWSPPGSSGGPTPANSTGKHGDHEDGDERGGRGPDREPQRSVHLVVPPRDARSRS